MKDSTSKLAVRQVGVILLAATCLCRMPAVVGLLRAKLTGQVMGEGKGGVSALGRANFVMSHNVKDSVW